MNIHTIVIGHVTVEMLIAFFLGVGSLLLYSWKVSNAIKEGYGVKKYMTPSLPNILFHIFAGFAVLMALHEISEELLEMLGYRGSKTFHYTLSSLTGAFGGYFVAWIFERARKIINDKDANIEHIHDKFCRH